MYEIEKKKTYKSINITMRKEKKRKEKA